ncbi:MAG: PEP-CTERM sorting domain-containing protein [Pontiellaceae bacterium]|nr:PEP-CTERM sorting domain-containing protein [Pontiellaceae bacterium]MBN2785154.1 PEP-CTERM sorting domain-containing protein [Pontiellaceae bacterium]
MKMKYVVAGLVTCIACVTHAGVVDFQVESFVNAGNGYVEEGLHLISNDDGSSHAIFPDSISESMLGVASINEGWLGFAPNVEFTFVPDAGGAFDLYSMDIAASTVGSGICDFVVIGTTASGSTTNTFSGVTTIQTESFNWTDLTSVTFYSTGSDGGVDKLSTSVIPEPATFAFMGVFGIGALAVRRIFMM